MQIGTLSPITLEVVRNGLVAYADEMAAVVERTAYNTMIYEIHDYACGLVDAAGRLIAQNRGGVPIFLADLGFVVQDGLATFGAARSAGGAVAARQPLGRADAFAPGDVVLVNHPRVCGQHLNNVVVYTPLLWEGELVAFPCARAHWIDVGGLSTGFGASSSRDVYQEGLQLRAVKIYEAGRPNEVVLNLIRDNIRFPESSFGDLRAQIAACRLGERRLGELLGRYGLATVRACIERLYAESEQLARRAVARIPDGVYEAEAFLDHDRVRLDQPVPIRVRVTVQGDEMVADFSESAPTLAGPLNSGPTGGGLAAARVAFKCLVAPDAPVNEGAFAPLRVVTAPGRFLSAAPPAPMGSYSVPFPTVIDTMLRALAPALPDVIPAAHKGTMGAGISLQGHHPRTGTRYVCVNAIGGGWGGGPSVDGENAVSSIAQGDVQNAPVELQEAYYPLRIERYGLRPDSGGAGAHRGGLGVEAVYRALADMAVKTDVDRTLCPPWGLWGGQSAQVGATWLRQPDAAAPEAVHSIDGYPLRAGGEAAFLTAGGGGWGNPLARDPARVAEDVQDGYISAEAARQQYGVVLDAAGGVDAAATARERARRSAPEDA